DGREETRGGSRRRAVGREREGKAGPRSHKASACQEPSLRQGARQGLARLSRAEVPVRLSQGPLSRYPEERRARVLPARARQSLSRPPPTCVRIRGNAGRRRRKPQQNTAPTPETQNHHHPSRQPNVLFRWYGCAPAPTVSQCAKKAPDRYEAERTARCRIR